MYKITLSDGTVIDNLILNGNNFISAKELTEVDFRGKLNTVTIGGPEGEVVHGPMKLVQCRQYGTEWWFILEDMTPQEILNNLIEKRQANADAAIRSIMTVLAKFKLPGGNG